MAAVRSFKFAASKLNTVVICHSRSHGQKFIIDCIIINLLGLLEGKQVSEFLPRIYCFLTVDSRRHVLGVLL
jgi:hypothetical protein